MPHYLLAHHRQLALITAVLSLLLSLWALYLDPVVNRDGILYIEAADHFSHGQWAAGFSIYKWPFYSFVIGLVSYTTGMSAGHAAYLVNAGLYALTVLGFVAFVKVLGGSGRVLWLAAIVVLLHPDLNAFRSFVIRDVGYWACYLWSLAFYLAYVRGGDSRLLLSGILIALGGFLFRIEGVVLITVVPACLYTHRSGIGTQTTVVLLAAALATGAAIAAAPLWHYVSEVNISTELLLGSPLHHLAGSWAMLAGGIEDRLAALQREIPGVASGAAAVPVYLVTVLAMALLELIKSVGVVFSGIIVYAFVRKSIFIPESIRPWWWFLVGIQAVLVLQFAFSNFFLAKRYPVALALTLLPIVPFFLDDIWRRCETYGRSYARNALIIAVLIAIESLDGLDVGTSKHYLRDAGLWLRANAPPGASFYSNDRILTYYSGLEEGKPNAEHSWREAMQEIWTNDWRSHDYFALVMTTSNRQNEVLLFRRIKAEPVKIFANDDGDRVLIFRPE